MLPLLLVSAAFASEHSPPAPPADDPSPRPTLAGWVEAGLLAEAAPEEEVVYGVDLLMARLDARYDDPELVGGRIQVEAATGTVQLLDAEVRVGNKESIWVTVGRFKVPLSADFLVPLPKMTVPTRALLVELAPTRSVGVEVGGHPVEAVEVRLGAFDPGGWVPQAGVGAVVAGVVGVELPAHLHLHLAGTHWLRPEDAVAALGVAAPDHDLRADVAVEHHHDGLTVAVEGLLARQVFDEEWAWGAEVLAAHRYDLGGSSFELEPALAGDLLSEGEAMAARGTAALNLHRNDWKMVESLSYEGEAELEGEGGMTHVVRLLAQVGF